MKPHPNPCHTELANMLMLDGFVIYKFLGFCSQFFLFNLQFWLTLLLTPTLQHWQDRDNELQTVCAAGSNMGSCLSNSLSLHRNLLEQFLLKTNDVDKIGYLAVDRIFGCGGCLLKSPVKCASLLISSPEVKTLKSCKTLELSRVLLNYCFVFGFGFLGGMIVRFLHFWDWRWGHSFR